MLVEVDGADDGSGPLDEVALLLIDPGPGWQAQPVEVVTARSLASGLAIDLGLGDGDLLAVVGRLLLPEGPDRSTAAPVVALALLVDPDGDAGQRAADRSSADGPAEDLGGHPWYAGVDDGAHSLVLCTAGFILCLVADDLEAVLAVAQGCADGWRAEATASPVPPHHHNP